MLAKSRGGQAVAFLARNRLVFPKLYEQLQLIGAIVVRRKNREFEQGICIPCSDVGTGKFCAGTGKNRETAVKARKPTREGRCTPSCSIGSTRADLALQARAQDAAARTERAPSAAPGRRCRSPIAWIKVSLRAARQAPLTRRRPLPTNLQVLLDHRPTDKVSPANFRVVETPVPTPGPGQVLVRQTFLVARPVYARQAQRREVLRQASGSRRGHAGRRRRRRRGLEQSAFQARRRGRRHGRLAALLC